MTGATEPRAQFRCSLGVVIPAGPGDDVVDTVRSVLRYTDQPRRIIVVDDTPDRQVESQLMTLSPDIVTVSAPTWAPGSMGGLWVKIALGMRTLLACSDPDVVLKLDADALITGPGLVEAARTALGTASRIGILGAVRFSPDGNRRDWVSPGAEVRAALGLRGLRHPRARTRLREIHALAARAGYVDGEHAQGGAYVMSPDLLRSLERRGWLDLPELAAVGLGEDFIFGMMGRAAGYTLADFSAPGQPMAVTWRGLCASPDTLVEQGRLVVHSVRYAGSMSETEVRAAFARHRDPAICWHGE